MSAKRLNRISIVLDEMECTQKTLAAYLEMDHNTISRWCRNVNQPSMEQLYSIADFFRIDNRRLLEPTHWDETGPSPFEQFQAQLAKTKTDRRKTPKKKTGRGR